MTISKVASGVCSVEIWDLIWIEDGALGSSLVDEIGILSKYSIFGSNFASLSARMDWESAPTNFEFSRSPTQLCCNRLPISQVPRIFS